ELVPRNARVSEEGHLAEVTAVVRAADADAVGAHERLARPRRGRLGNFNAAERAGFFELDGFHVLKRCGATQTSFAPGGSTSRRGKSRAPCMSLSAINSVSVKREKTRITPKGASTLNELMPRRLVGR